MMKRRSFLNGILGFLGISTIAEAKEYVLTLPYRPKVEVKEIIEYQEPKMQYYWVSNFKTACVKVIPIGTSLYRFVEGVQIEYAQDSMNVGPLDESSKAVLRNHNIRGI